MFNISTFKANLKVVRPNLFYASITLPPLLFTASEKSVDAKTLDFRCEATELPGRTIATYDDQSTGPTKKLAYDVTYNDINLQIIASEDMNERKYLEKWIDSIVLPNNGNYNASLGGLVNYYSTYATGQMSIFQLNDVGKQIVKCNLYQAYPIMLSPMNMSWEETNTYQRFTVTMTYRYHETIFY